MPKIQWADFPTPLRKHLFQRLADRKITAEDLCKLKLWRESDPDAPDGLGNKDFGSFKICGEGRFPKTLLLKGQAAKGMSLQIGLRILNSRKARPFAYSNGWTIRGLIFL
jgi:hypothetical protein